MIRVGISGGFGRMGRMIAEVVEHEADLELGGRYDPKQATADVLADSDVVVEVTRPDVVLANLTQWAAMGKHVVVGTSGFDDARRATLVDLWSGANGNCLVVPNFAVGAVLMMRFAEAAAPFFSSVQIIEQHHTAKADAPSGTAIATAMRIAATRRGDVAAETNPGTADFVEGVPVHSVRRDGVLADQDVIFGGPGETLTIRHHTADRAAFAPGVLLAVRRVGGLSDKVAFGLESVLDL